MTNIVDITKNSIEHLVAPGDRFKIMVTGYSMLPLLGYGRDVIVVRRTEGDEPILGRIAMFSTADRHIVVHRVVGIDGDMVIFQGDGNPYSVERCQRNEVIGVVEDVIREDGRVVSCTTRLWRLRERVWLWQPRIIRRYALAILRRMADFKRKQK